MLSSTTVRTFSDFTVALAKERTREDLVTDFDPIQDPMRSPFRKADHPLETPPISVRFTPVEVPFKVENRPR